MSASTQTPNKLINEKSPYLLQHAYNPVDWFPWCDEAFTKAKIENKPIFLSIGYSTCHWCHVMERESFEDVQVAKALSDNYISIKVDREERPDVDSVYMGACSAMTGSGGWPLSIFMDSEGKPFFAGTYYPKLTFLTVLQQINALWKTRRGDLDAQTRELTAFISRNDFREGDLDESFPQKAFLELYKNYDSAYGGFGTSPKFPSPHILMFLLRYAGKNKSALPLAQNTLDAYRNGGLYDHIGFGFFRYSTDRQIRIPHFEKMLYDNALLCLAYAEAYALTGEERYATTVREVITYLCRDMQSLGGGFYTAEDADSEGVEGKFYVFDKTGIESSLGEDAGLFMKIFPVTPGGNFDGKNHLYAADSALMYSENELVQRCRKKLMAVRNRRQRPLRDDKILTEQNGMALAALAVSGRVLADSTIIEQAKRTETFICMYLMEPDGSLVSGITDGKKGQPGFADDYVFYIYGLLELYFATGEDVYFQRAMKLNEKFISDFSSPDGGFFQSGRQGERLINRTRDIYDGAIPSSNAVAVNNFIKLSRLIHDDRLMDLAKETLRTFMGTIAESPMSYCFNAINLQMFFDGGTDIVLTGESLEDLKEIRGAIPYQSYATIRTIIGDDPLYPLPDGKPAAYICTGKRCLPPVTDADSVKRVLTSFNIK